jgi:hypothetical protein
VRAASDGYTLGSVYAVNATLYDKLGYSFMQTLTAGIPFGRRYSAPFSVR